MATAKQVFKALLHIEEVWITADGHHHLHDHKGGEKFCREDQIEEESNDEQAETLPVKGKSKAAKI